MLDHGDSPQAAHHSDADQLQADVQPLHGGCAEEAAALVQLKAPGVFFLKPGMREVTELQMKLAEFTADEMENVDKNHSGFDLSEQKTDVRGVESLV